MTNKHEFSPVKRTVTKKLANILILSEFVTSWQYSTEFGLEVFFVSVVEHYIVLGDPHGP